MGWGGATPIRVLQIFHGALTKVTSPPSVGANQASAGTHLELHTKHNPNRRTGGFLSLFLSYLEKSCENKADLICTNSSPVPENNCRCHCAFRPNIAQMQGCDGDG